MPPSEKTPPEGPGRLSRGDRRARIVEAAICAAGEHSLAAVSMADVASEAGVSKAAVFKHFPTREALIHAVLDELSAFFGGLFERARADTDDPVRVLLNLSLAYGSSLETHLPHARIVMSWTGWGGAGGATERGRQLFRGYVGLIEETIREGMRRGAIDAEIDAEFAAWSFMGYAFSVGSAKLVGRPPEWISQLQIALLRSLLGHRAVDRVLAGSRPDGLARWDPSPR